MKISHSNSITEYLVEETTVDNKIMNWLFGLMFAFSVYALPRAIKEAGEENGREEELYRQRYDPDPETNKFLTKPIYN